MAWVCLFTSPWCFIFMFTLLAQLLPCINGATYHSHDITSDTVCHPYYKRVLQVYMTEPVILEARPESRGKLVLGTPLMCTFEMEAKGIATYGVTSVVQDMNFRGEEDNCLDYIQTIYQDENYDMKLHRERMGRKKKISKKVLKSDVLRERRDTEYEYKRGPRICGRVLFGLEVDENETLPPPFASPLPRFKPIPDQAEISSFSWDAPNPYQFLVSEAAEVDHKTQITTFLHVSNRKPRVDEEVRFKIVYTAYHECDGRNHSRSLFHCGYGLCISSDLVNDGLVNCPFGDCIDETNCTNAKMASVTADVFEYEPTEERSVWWMWMWVSAALLLVFVLCSVAGFLYMRRSKN